jgi:hypothetical protein
MVRKAGMTMKSFVVRADSKGNVIEASTDCVHDPSLTSYLQWIPFTEITTWVKKYFLGIYSGETEFKLYVIRESEVETEVLNYEYRKK